VLVGSGLRHVAAVDRLHYDSRDELGEGSCSDQEVESYVRTPDLGFLPVRVLERRLHGVIHRPVREKVRAEFSVGEFRCP
jgi:hypothetical protein